MTQRAWRSIGKLAQNAGKAVFSWRTLMGAASLGAAAGRGAGRGAYVFVRSGQAALWGSRALTAAMIGLAVLFIGFAPKAPEGADIWDVNRPPSITLVDSEGDILATRGAIYGEAVSVADLPPYFVEAFLATEDRRFYDHRGVDLRGTARAFVTNVRAGALREGGSTITQQLAKNLYLSPDRTLVRKAKEAMLALWLEGRYDKNEILSLYLNRIYLGAGAYGVEAAAQHYFGKSAAEATLAEAAMLAGLPKAPSALAPTRNLEGAQARAADVLDNLVETGDLDRFDAMTAKAAPAVPVNRAADSGLGYFFDYIAAKAVALAPSQRDLIVHTTLNARLQKVAESAVTATLAEEGEMLNANQAALIAYDRDGALLAMVGGESYKESQFNRAVQAKRQPGSAFKPFVYLAALEAGMTPKSKFVDGPIEIGDWAPQNYSDVFVGEVRLAEAMAKSINTVAVQVSEETGRDNVAAVAERLGVSSDLTPHPSLALGASEVTLNELTAAYLPFQNRGAAVAPYAIRMLTDGEGEVLFEKPSPETARLMDRSHADEMTHMLYQVLHSGTGGRARLGDRSAAGKTGTSQEWRDAWFVGYTHQITAGVWVGNDDRTPMNEVTGGNLPAEIWRAFMSGAHTGAPSVRLPGAYPAITAMSEEALTDFYDDLEYAFDRLDGGARRGLFGRR